MFAGRRETALEASEALAAALPAGPAARRDTADGHWWKASWECGCMCLCASGCGRRSWPAFWGPSALLRDHRADSLRPRRGPFGHLARGQAAERERELLAAAIARIPESRYLFNNTALDILAIAAAMLDGELDYRRGDYESAWRNLLRAIELDDNCPTTSPGVDAATRHAYGALLLEQGEVERAAAVYAADLGLDTTLPRACQHPNNVWSLHGYHECLTRLKRFGDAARIKPELDRALSFADVEITASCFCRASGAECAG